MEHRQIDELEMKLQYHFVDPNLIAEALHHSSFVNEQTDRTLRDNERFEFLGDAVLNLVIGHLLMMNFPDLKEGDLSRMRATLVNESQLAAIAGRLDLGAHIRLGKGESQTGGRQKKSILADTYEAVIAAVYLDGGFETARDILRVHFSDPLATIGLAAAHIDYKSQLQEILQAGANVMPRYRVVSESGPDHDKTFTVEVIAGQVTRSGIGKSKKTAEQQAARKALKVLRAAEQRPAKDGQKSQPGDLPNPS